MAEDKKSEADEPETDEYGLAIQKYESIVLLVVPPEAYSEETLRYARSCLYNVHVGSRSVSEREDDLIKGRLQDEFQVDGPLAGETMEPYSGVIFVGGPGAARLAENPEAVRLAREADAEGKLIGAWGESVGVLVRAGILKGRRLTGDPSLEREIREARGKYTGNQVERDGHLVTGQDDSAGMRFGKALAQVVGI